MENQYSYYNPDDHQQNGQNEYQNQGGKMCIRDRSTVEQTAAGLGKYNMALLLFWISFLYGRI